MSSALAHTSAACAPDPAEALAERLASRQARVAVLGLGHVGLPLARAIARAGFPTLGYDIDPERIAALGSEPVLPGLPTIELRALTAAGRLRLSADAATLADAEVFVVCVPTPLAADRTPDLGAVVAAMRAVAARLRPGSLVILESTTYPGTTRGVAWPIVRAAASDVFVAYSPEREDPGNREFDTASIPKLVAGIDDASRDLALRFYGAVVDRVVPVDSPEIAEAAKLYENVFRAVGIALANEMKQTLGAMGIDVWSVTRAAATKPFGFMPFWPGPGVGGHCIPVDPLYLAWAARQHGTCAPLIELATAINAAMPDRIVERLARVLAERGVALAGARVLVLGVGYKRDQGDCRDSPGVGLMAALEEAGAAVAFHDPLVPVLPGACVPPSLSGRLRWSWSTAGLRRFDAAIVATDHTRVDYAAVVRAVPVVLDTRDVCARLGLDAPSIVPA